MLLFDNSTFCFKKIFSSQRLSINSKAPLVDSPNYRIEVPINIHPYSWLTDFAKLPVLVVSTTLTIILTVALSWIGRSLNTKAAPLGIICFELAGSRSRANQILDSWSELARRDAFLSLGLDYLYLCVYPLALSLACHLAAVTNRGLWLSIGELGVYTSWLVLFAIPLDALEDYALIRVLKSSGDEVWPIVAKWCAIPKFGLVILGLGYILIWLAFQVVEKLV